MTKRDRVLKGLLSQTIVWFTLGLSRCLNKYYFKQETILKVSSNESANQNALSLSMNGQKQAIPLESSVIFKSIDNNNFAVLTQNTVNSLSRLTETKKYWIYISWTEFQVGWFLTNTLPMWISTTQLIWFIVKMLFLWLISIRKL